MRLRRTLKHILESREGYFRFRYSAFVLKGFRLLRPAFAQLLNKQETLYSGLLRDTKNLVFDIGGNEGFTAEIFLRLAKRVVIVEPSERNLRILRARFRHTKNVEIVPAAASDRAGKRIFFDNSSNYAYSTLDEEWLSLQEVKRSDLTSYEVNVTTLDRLIEKFGRPDLIKIDVEGHEVSVIKGLSSPVPLISFEAVLPHYRAQAIANIRHLCSLSQSCTFNFAVNEVMQHAGYISAEELISDIEKLDHVTIDIFCRS